jgi:fibronectin-binding autotransporter adhesin
MTRPDPISQGQRHHPVSTQGKRQRRFRRLLLEPLEARHLLAVRIWDGGGTDDYWTTAANWVDDLTPVAGDMLQFAGTTRLSPVNNFTGGTVFAGIEFVSGAGEFTLSGNQITLAANVVNSDDSPQTIDLPMSFAEDRTFETAGGDLIIGGVLSGDGGLIKAGTGTLRLLGTNTYGGATAVQAGTLDVRNAGRIQNTSGISVAEHGTFRHAPTTTADYTFDRSITGDGAIRIQYVGTHQFWLNSSLSDFHGQVIFESGEMNRWIRPDGNFSSETARFHLEGGANVNLNGDLVWGQFSGDPGALLGSSGGGARMLTFGHLDTDAAYAGGVNNVAISFSKVGFGTQTFAQNLNRSNATTTIQAGAIQVGNGGTTGHLGGSGSITISNNASLIFNRSDDLTVSNTITGSGELTQGGSGTLVLTANNNYAGGTTVTGGVLQIGNGGTTGAFGTGAVLNDATVVFNRSNDLTVSNPISGSGALSKAGAGRLTLSNAHSYSGPTTVSSGRLDLTGTLSSDILVDDGASLFASSGSTTGSLTLNSGGTLLLAGGVNTTSLVAEGGSSFGESSWLDFLAAPTENTIYDVVSYGAGETTNLENLNPFYRGTLQNDNANQKITFTAGQYGAVRTWNTTDGIWNAGITANWAGGDGRFYFGDHAVFGALTSDATIELSGTLRPGSVTVSNASDAYHFTGGTLDGGTTLTKTGAGTLVLHTDQTYTGSTTISAGLLRIGDGGTTGTLGTGPVTNNATLRFNRSNNYSVSNAIGGSGSLVQAGAGTLALLANNAYTGATTVQAGTLDVTGTGRIQSTSGISVAEDAIFRYAPSAAHTFNRTISGYGTVRLRYAASGNFLVNSNLSGFAGQVIFESGSGWIRPNASFSSETATFHLNSGTQVNLNGDLSWGQFSGDTGAVLGSSGGGARTLTFGHLNTDATYAGTVNSVPISFVKVGSGTQTFTQNLNRTSGSGTGTATIQAGAIQVGNGGTTGDLGGGTITNNARLFFNRSNDFSVSNTIEGSGTVTKTGAGTLTPTGNNSYTGGTTITGGMIQANHNSALGSGTVTLASGAKRLMLGNGVSLDNDIIIQSGVSPDAFWGAVSATGGGTISGTVTIQAATTNGGHFRGGDGSDRLDIAGPIDAPDSRVMFRAGNIRLSGGGDYTGGLFWRRNFVARRRRRPEHHSETGLVAVLGRDRLRSERFRPDSCRPHANRFRQRRRHRHQHRC